MRCCSVTTTLVVHWVTVLYAKKLVHRDAVLYVIKVCLLSGVGGHGGSGVHADIDDKYREIVGRISVQTAAHAPRPFVNLSTRTAKNNGPVAGKQLTAVRHERVTGAQVGGMSRYDRELQRANRANDTTAAAGGNVEQVHVPKCAVCTLL